MRRSLRALAVVLQAQGQVTEAEVLFRETLAMQRKLFGSVHERVAVGECNLGVALQQQGKFSEAETRFREALNIRTTLFGKKHRLVAQTECRLAEVLGRQGKVEPAESLFREALAMQKELLGPEHADTADTLSRLAVLVGQQGRVGEAEALDREALRMLKNLFGEENPKVIFELNNLAALLRDQGRPAEAEVLFLEALTLEKKTNGKENPRLEFSLINLAGLYAREGKLAEEEAMRREVLAILRKSLGDEHPKVADAWLDVAIMLIKAGKNAEYEFVRVEATLARLGLPPARLRQLGLERATQIVTDALDNGITRTNESPASYLAARSWLLGQRGRWQASIADLSRAVEINTNFPLKFALGPMLVETGDLDRYRVYRLRMMAKFLGTTDPLTAAEAAMVLLLKSAETGMPTASQLAETAVTRGTNDARFSYFQLVQGLADYRRGRFSDAADWTRKSLASSETNHTTAVAAGAVLAMTLHQLKQAEQSSRILDDAVARSRTRLPGLESGDLGEGWPAWLAARILLSEAMDSIRQGRGKLTE